MGGKSAAISCAMTRGAFLNWRARWKAIGSANSPNAASLGCSTTIGGRPAILVERWALICSRMRRSMTANTSFIVTGGSRWLVRGARGGRHPANRSGRVVAPAAAPQQHGGQRRFNRLQEKRRESDQSKTKMVLD